MTALLKTYSLLTDKLYSRLHKIKVKVALCWPINLSWHYDVLILVMQVNRINLYYGSLQQYWSVIKLIAKSIIDKNIQQSLYFIIITKIILVRYSTNKWVKTTKLKLIISNSNLISFIYLLIGLQLTPNKIL